MHAAPTQSRKKECVKGLHVCQLCGKDYINKSDLNSHLMAHAGVMFNCERCGLQLPSQKAVDNHMKLHTKGPFSCPKCMKGFNLHTTMQNHIKTHNEHPYTFDCCNWETRSYALSLKHKKYGHLSEKLFSCKVCTKKFQMLTQLYSHENKVHGICKWKAKTYV